MKTQLCAAALCLAASSASAQWTLPQHNFGVRLTSSYSNATHEWHGLDGESSSRRRYPIGGRYDRFDLAFDLRWGVTSRFELGARIETGLASYRADPFLVEEAIVGEVGADDVFDVSGREAGLADIYLNGTLNLVRSRFALAARLEVKLPGGYQKPEGTFRGSARTTDELVANFGALVRPGNTSDTVTLGLGQVDIIAALPLGYAARSRTFIVFEPAYALRLGGGGDQVRARLAVGQSIGPVLTLVATGHGEFSVQDGEVVGVSLTIEPPETRGSDFPVARLGFRPQRLQRDSVRVSGAAILRFERVELGFRYERTVWGRNTGEIQSFGLSIGAVFDGSQLFGAGEAEVDEAREEATEEYAEDEVRDEYTVEAGEYAEEERENQPDDAPAGPPELPDGDDEGPSGVPADSPPDEAAESDTD